MADASRPTTSGSTASSNPRPGIVYSATGEFDIREYYFNLLKNDPTKSMPIAAIESLSALCDGSKAETIHELMKTIEQAAKTLKESVPNPVSLTAGANLFKKFLLQRLHNDPRDFETFKKTLQENGHLFAQRARAARNKVAAAGVKAIRDGSVVFLHGHSRCITALCLKAATNGRRFKVIVTQTGESQLGARTATELRKAGIEVALIPDTAMAYAMPKATIVLMGAEGVFANGFCLNILGSMQLAMAAQYYKKPVYICAETHKFVDMFPLDQFRLPVTQNIVNFTDSDEPAPESSSDKPALGPYGYVDIIPKDLITGYITEIGLLSPQEAGHKIVMMRFE
ncbi:nagb/rpia/CoA transferase-like protein [Ascodesmis nigricans]|uniref:Translation initiation factor eIF2B subunit alpha n=1 Tax=Ascodesmis nigricans TaxID=341454 RepID=A0A4V3SJ32_9PEZI|nr:nagb/rpia/CoA transferase-like protein [Ascodesmis nigricans]